MTLTAVARKRLPGGFELDVTLLVSPGITMLFGASGSGKTTLLRCIAGLIAPDAGSISIGHDVLFSAGSGINVPPWRRRVGYVFQQLALFPHMTLADNIGYGLAGEDRQVRRERIDVIASSFRIRHALGRKPAQVSGGERQRAALARSLVIDPCALLLDEPLSALDHATQSLIIDDLRRWNETHRIPILYVTHSHREVFALGHRVVGLDRGHIIADGSPSEVLEAPAREAIAEIAGFENLFSARIVAIRPDAGTMLCRLDGGVELEAPLSTEAAEDRSGPASEPAVRIAIRAGDILLAAEQPRGLSARNIVAGRIESLRREGPTVVAHVEAGDRFVVDLTPGAVDELRLARGSRVWLVIKTYSCRVVKRAGPSAPGSESRD